MLSLSLVVKFINFSTKKNIQFRRQPRGSLFELIDHLTVALDERYINKDNLFF